MTSGRRQRWLARLTTCWRDELQVRRRRPAAAAAEARCHGVPRGRGSRRCRRRPPSPPAAAITHKSPCPSGWRV